MAKTLADYLMLVEKEYEYKIKLAADVSERQFFLIEALLQKYDLKDVKDIIRTPIQRHADFCNIAPTEVYIIDFVTRMPLSPSALIQEINVCAKIPLDRIIVRGKNDPLAVAERKEEEMADKEYVAKISDPFYETDGVVVEHEYGTEFNKEVVDMIVGAQGREVTTNEKKFDSIFKQKVDAVKRPVSPLTDIDKPEPKAE